MTPALSPDIAQERYAHNLGLTLEEYLLRYGHLLAEGRTQFLPRDEWERKLLSATTSDGVSLSDYAVSSEGIYD